MPTAVIMPKFEMAQETGKVAAWLKAEGDVIRKGDAILEVETDKVNQEVEALADGILMGITAQPGDVVPIGQAIAYIVKPGESFSGGTPAPAARAVVSAEQPAPSQPTHREASHAAAASPLAVRLAESLGIDLALVRGTGPRGQVTREDVEAHAVTQSAASAPGDGKVRAVPAARRLARELGVDLHSVHGAGPEGRIQPEDVRAHLAAATVKQTVVATPPAVHSQPPVASPGSPAIRRRVPLTNIRRTIAERMTGSVREAPQFTVSVDVDMGRALAIVEDLKAGAAEGKPKITLTALIVKACAWALRQHPEANASFQEDGIVEWDEVNIGVATAIDQGLIVPVVRAADTLGLRGIAAGLADLTVRAREGKLKLDDLQGGTFTVSNLGMFGIDRFTAIVNPPQAAILAVGRVTKRAEVTADDKIEIRPMASLTMTADHRVLDGAMAARLLATVQSALEHPGLLLE